MRKTLFIPIFSLCFLSSLAEAQLIRSLGVKAGASAASQDWLYADRDISVDALTRWGLDIGGFIEWFNIPVFSLSSEVHYIQKGFREELPVTSAESPDSHGMLLTLSPRVDYLSVPILAKCRFDLGSSSLYILAGPRVDFLLSTKDAGFGEVLSNFKSREFGATVGLGYEATKLGPLTIGAEVRYSPTLQDSFSTNLLSVRNRSLEMIIVIGY
jgi:hypothetical protein